MICRPQRANGDNTSRATQSKLDTNNSNVRAAGSQQAVSLYSALFCFCLQNKQYRREKCHILHTQANRSLRKHAISLWRCACLLGYSPLSRLSGHLGPPSFFLPFPCGFPAGLSGDRATLRKTLGFSGAWPGSRGRRLVETQQGRCAVLLGNGWLDPCASHCATKPETRRRKKHIAPPPGSATLASRPAASA